MSDGFRIEGKPGVGAMTVEAANATWWRHAGLASSFRALAHGLVPVSIAVMTAGCGGAAVEGASDPRVVLDGIARRDLERVAGKRIYFGHQSIGANIVGGLESLVKERPDLGIKVVKTRNPADFDAAVFGHDAVGKNHDAASKIEDFAATLEAGLGAKTDIAFFKFCYVDIEADTDVEKLLAEYKERLGAVRGKFPRTRIVHVTTPLSVVQTGPKAFVKKIIGKKRWGADANVQRNRFNALLRREYLGREPLFDLAAIEATRPDGTTATFDEGGRDWAMPAAEYVSDGKHLNDRGARLVAAHLLKTLAALPD